MKKYFLVSIQNLALIIVGLFDDVIEGHPDIYKAKRDGDVIAPEYSEKFKAALDDHEKDVKYLGLRQSLKYIATMRGKLSESDYTYREYERDVDILHGREEHELEDITFGFIPADKADYYQNKELFGAAVNGGFPSTVKDIYEAGNCYAHGNYTASVFHLMRVLEIALQKLAVDLGVTFPAAIELENWKNIIDKIDAAIKAQEQLPKSTQKSEDLQFYSEAVKEFRYFKDAWRNHVSHSRMDYEVHDATKIMEHVKDFMQHLATRLKE